MQIVCTLCEREDYFRGCLVLLNSLLSSEFDGLFIIGHRRVPSQLLKRAQKSFTEYRDGTHCEASLQLIEVDTNRHLTNYKPFFLRERIADRAGSVKAVWYIDPDVVVKANWLDLTEWVKYGIAVCEDINSPVYKRDPRRMQWKALAEDHDIQAWNPLDIYFNGGFIGLHRSHFDFLQRWQSFIEIMENFNEVPSAADQNFVELRDQFKASGAGDNHPFIHLDQDCLNAALSCSPWPISAVGKMGMDFAWGGRWMSHAVGAHKPWNKPFIRSALQGKGPRRVDRLYWQHADGPLPAHSPREIRKAQHRIKMAAFVERFIA